MLCCGVRRDADEGGSFSENEMYYAETRLPEVPYTYEMWLYIPSDVQTHSGTNRLGTVMSNYANYSKRPYFQSTSFRTAETADA